MKQTSWFDYHFGGWLWLIRYKVANFVIGYNIEDALEEHLAQGWEEGLEAKFKLLDGEDSISLTNPYAVKAKKE